MTNEHKEISAHYGDFIRDICDIMLDQTKIYTPQECTFVQDHEPTQEFLYEKHCETKFTPKQMMSSVHVQNYIHRQFIKPQNEFFDNDQLYENMKYESLIHSVATNKPDSPFADMNNDELKQIYQMYNSMIHDHDFVGVGSRTHVAKQREIVYEVLYMRFQCEMHTVIQFLSK